VGGINQSIKPFSLRDKASEESGLEKTYLASVIESSRIESFLNLKKGA
jgi:hypothetical protein